MKLSETRNMMVNQILEQCEIVDLKYHTDDNNNIKAIEVKYAPSATEGCKVSDLPSASRPNKHPFD